MKHLENECMSFQWTGSFISSKGLSLKDPVTAPSHSVTHMNGGRGFFFLSLCFWLWLLSADCVPCRFKDCADFRPCSQITENTETLFCDDLYDNHFWNRLSVTAEHHCAVFTHRHWGPSVGRSRWWRSKDISFSQRASERPSTLLENVLMAARQISELHYTVYYLHWFLLHLTKKNIKQ